MDTRNRKGPDLLKECLVSQAEHNIPVCITLPATDSAARLTRRQAIKAAAETLAVAGVAALSAPAGGGSAGAAESSLPQTGRAGQRSHDARPAEKLRIATCQFPVGSRPAENAKYIRDFMHRAAEEGAHLLHTSEACLSGYAGSDFETFENI